MYRDARHCRDDGQYAPVQANHGNGCGAGKLSRLFCGKPRQFQVNNPVNAGVGDEVILSVAEGAVLRGICPVYLLPLLLLVTGAMLGNLWAAQPGQRDAYTAVGAMSGLVAGFIFAKWLSSRQDRQQNQPYIARQCGRGD